MVYCSVPLCKTTGKTRHKKPRISVSLHEFPSDAVLRFKWLLAIARKDPETNKMWIPTDASRVCGIHFHRSCYHENQKIRRLLPGSIPTIFPGYPEYLQKRESLKKSQKKCL